MRPENLRNPFKQIIEFLLGPPISHVTPLHHFTHYIFLFSPYHILKRSKLSIQGYPFVLLHAICMIIYSGRNALQLKGIDIYAVHVPL